jgi:hypothetical protein
VAVVQAVAMRAALAADMAAALAADMAAALAAAMAAALAAAMAAAGIGNSCGFSFKKARLLRQASLFYWFEDQCKKIAVENGGLLRKNFNARHGCIAVQWNKAQ